MRFCRSGPRRWATCRTLAGSSWMPPGLIGLVRSGSLVEEGLTEGERYQSPRAVLRPRGCLWGGGYGHSRRAVGVSPRPTRWWGSSTRGFGLLGRRLREPTHLFTSASAALMHRGSLLSTDGFFEMSQQKADVERAAFTEEDENRFPTALS